MARKTRRNTKVKRKREMGTVSTHEAAKTPQPVQIHPSPKNNSNGGRHKNQKSLDSY